MPSSQDRTGPPDLTPYVLAWRTTPLRDREVVDALVHPAHAAPSPQLAQALEGWGGSYYWSDEPGGRWLILTRRRSAPRERWWLHLTLFFLTLVTTTIVGAALHGSVVMEDSFGMLRGRIAFTTDPAHAIAAGLPFSVPLLAILLTHELGHYITARRYLLDVSPPYFIPLPLWSFIGTMGAFIRLRTVLSDRRQLFDVGIAGPFAGFAVALPVLVIGLLLSHPVAPGGPGGADGMVLWVGGDRLLVGDSPITLAVRWLLYGGRGVTLHTVAFAGVIGMFVTMINLMPMAQLDGGHVLYAAQPRLHRRVALAFWVVVLGLGHWWAGWYVWAGLVLVLSRGRLNHPTVLDSYRPLPPSRRALAWAGLGLFVLTLMPVPFRL